MDEFCGSRRITEGKRRKVKGGIKEIRMEVERKRNYFLIWTSTGSLKDLERHRSTRGVDKGLIHHSRGEQMKNEVQIWLKTLKGFYVLY